MYFIAFIFGCAASMHRHGMASLSIRAGARGIHDEMPACVAGDTVQALGRRPHP